eukprot:843985-Pyramimonas_sp.AAC.1
MTTPVICALCARISSIRPRSWARRNCPDGILHRQRCGNLSRRRFSMLLGRPGTWPLQWTRCTILPK